MREVRFRGTTKDGRTVLGFLGYIQPRVAFIVDEDGKSHAVLPETVRQWTGFRTKTGADIYEDDQVTYRGIPCQIRFNDFAGKCYICSKGKMFIPLNASTAQDCE